MCPCMLSCFGHVQLFTALWTVACQASLVMGFSRQEYWSFHAFFQEISPTQGSSLNLLSPALAGMFFTTTATFGRPLFLYTDGGN